MEDKGILLSIFDITGEPWEQLSSIIRKWVVISQFRQDNENYEKLKQRIDGK